MIECDWMAMEYECSSLKTEKERLVQGTNCETKLCFIDLAFKVVLREITIEVFSNWYSKHRSKTRNHWGRIIQRGVIEDDVVVLLSFNCISNMALQRNPSITE